MSKLVYLICFLLVLTNLESQNLDPNLRQYIKIGLSNNLDLSGSREILKTYDAKQKQAFSGFLPRLELSSRYSRAGGGRSFVFPLGSLLNPVYSKLNIPIKLNDESVKFIRAEEQDTKLELIQPLFNAAIYFNYSAQDNIKEAARNEYQGKELNLAEKIIIDYYNYAKTLRLVGIREYAMSLAKSNKFVTEKLYAVDKVNKSDILRADVLESQTLQELMAAKNMSSLAMYSFNITLNRKYEDKIELDSIPLDVMITDKIKTELSSNLSLDELIKQGLTIRPEFSQLDNTQESLTIMKKAISSDYLPSLTLVADYGIQGEKYTIDTESRYWMVSGMFKWNLFSGFETSAKEQVIEAQKKALSLTKQSTEQMIMLEIKNNFENLNNLILQYDVAIRSYISAKENYEISKKRYEQNLVPYISLLDAQTSYKISMENLIITYYDTMIAKWKLIKSSGIIPQ